MRRRGGWRVSDSDAVPDRGAAFVACAHVRDGATTVWLARIHVLRRDRPRWRVVAGLPALKPKARRRAENEPTGGAVGNRVSVRASTGSFERTPPALCVAGALEGAGNRRIQRPLPSFAKVRFKLALE